MRYSDIRQGGRGIKLFDAFLEAHDRDAEMLAEAGYDYDSLSEAITRGEELDERLLESGSSSDFPEYLNDKVTKRLMWGYADEPSAWRAYCRTYSVPDFKPITFTRLTEMQQLLEVQEGGPYEDSQIEQIVGPSITVHTFGRTFSLTRKALINDDLNQLRDRPAGMGRAAARTLGRDVVNNLVQNPNAYDGGKLISAEHKNMMTGAEAFLSEDSAAQAIVLLAQQTEPNGNIIGLRGRQLVIPIALELIARRIIYSTLVPEPQTGLTPAKPITAPGIPWTAQQFGRGGTNVMAGFAGYVVEPYLVAQTDWYYFADQNEAPVLGVGFLNGDETPDIFLKDPGMRNVLGGSDPYSGEYDEIFWKCRHEWGVAVLDWRGLVGAIGA
jgi:hypothetical protein